MSATPIFNYIQQGSSTKGFISACYTMRLTEYLENYPCTVLEKWEADVGTISGKQWEEALGSVHSCSLNVFSGQLHILLRVYYTPPKLHALGLRPDSICSKCGRDHGDLVHMLWRCPKLYRYWNTIVTTINGVMRIRNWQ